MKPYANRTAVESFVADLKDSYLQCRELGHNWRPFTAAFNRKAHCYDRVLRCTRCRTERWQVVSAHGEVVSSQYRYPDGYSSNGVGRIVGEGRDALRLESILRTVHKGDT